MMSPVDTHPASVLADTDLPRPEREVDVVAAYERWTENNIPDVLERHFLLDDDDPDRSVAGISIGPKARTIVELISCLRRRPSHWGGLDSIEGLQERIDRIERTLRPGEAVSSLLSNKLADYVVEECRRRTCDPAGLVSFLKGAHLRVDGDGMVSLVSGRTIPLGVLLDAVGGDGILLWRLRTMIRSGITIFDEALTAHQPATPEIVRTGLRRLFREPGTRIPDPSTYIRAFEGFLGDAILIPIILDGLGACVALTNGSCDRPKVETWLDILVSLRGWRPEHIRAFVHLRAHWSSHPYACGAILLSAAGDIAATCPRSAAFAAMHLLRIVRSLAKAGLTPDEVDRQQAWRETIGSLPHGTAISGLSTYLDDLPLSDDDPDCTWECLGDGTKGQWRWDVRSSTVGDPALAHALAEFLFAFGTRDCYDDVEPLLLELMFDEVGVAFLDELSSTSHRRTLLRARGLRHRLLTWDPADPR